MKAFLVNYNYTPTWLLESDLDYIISDRSDDGIQHLKDFDESKIIKLYINSHNKLNLTEEDIEHYIKYLIYNEFNDYFTTKRDLQKGIDNINDFVKYYTNLISSQEEHTENLINLYYLGYVRNVKLFFEIH